MGAGGGGGGGCWGHLGFFDIFCPTVPKNFLGGSPVIPKCSFSEKFMEEKGVITFFRWNFFLS